MPRKPRKRGGCLIIVIGLILLSCPLVLIIARSPLNKTTINENNSIASTNDPGQNGSLQNITDLIIPAGKLHEYADSYPWNQDVFVRKNDGTIDSRPNDLEELCKDWLFYRYKILEAEGAGQSEQAEDYRATFQDVNSWLADYAESDWGTMFTILENDGYSWP